MKKLRSFRLEEELVNKALTRLGVDPEVNDLTHLITVLLSEYVANGKVYQGEASAKKTEKKPEPKEKKEVESPAKNGRRTSMVIERRTPPDRRSSLLDTFVD